jgi:CheY-like chemotaxis protein
MPLEDVGDARIKILVVDDIETNREIVEAYLRDNNYDVVSVDSAVDAIRLIQTERYDVILMDIQMPVMDGVTATRCIRALADPPKNIPIIAMTGNVLPQQVLSFLAAGMNDHVGKPIERGKLYSSVRRWTSRTEARDVIVALNWRSWS